jgi:hypothetical protein
MLRRGDVQSRAVYPHWLDAGGLSKFLAACSYRAKALLMSREGFALERGHDDDDDENAARAGVRLVCDRERAGNRGPFMYLNECNEMAAIMAKRYRNVSKMCRGRMDSQPPIRIW